LLDTGADFGRHLHSRSSYEQHVRILIITIDESIMTQTACF
jgi:hypothetical protein